MNESEPKREQRDLKAPIVLGFFASLAVTLVLVALAARGLMALFAHHQPRVSLPPVTSLAVPAPGPKLEVNPPAALQALHAREDEVLNTYGWMDPDHGIVHIPIDRAIDLVAQRGLPAATNKNAEAPKP